MSPLDPRLERHKPALVYDPQEAYRAMSAASIVDYPNNALKRSNGSIVSRAGAGLALAMLTTYAFRDGDRLDAAGDPLPASRRFQADPAYRERVYGRVKEDGGRVWLQYWLWCYYNPKHLLGLGKHEGDWEVVQIGLGDDGTPEVVTFSQHEGGEARDWEDVKRQGDHPVVYVAPLSHACYFEPGAHPYVLGVDNPDGRLPRECFRTWRSSACGRLGRAGGATPRASAAGSSAVAARRARAARARSGTTRPRGTCGHGRRRRCGARGAWCGPRARRRIRSCSTSPPTARTGACGSTTRSTGRCSAAPRGCSSRSIARARSRRCSGVSRWRSRPAAGRSRCRCPEGVEGDVVVRASAYNVLRQRSDPLEAVASEVGPAGQVAEPAAARPARRRGIQRPGGRTSSS